MPGPSDNFQSLAHQFGLMMNMVNEFKDPKDRMHLLRHLKVLLTEIDALILSDLKRDSRDTTSSSPPVQSTSGS
jgi:hypothetical protein